MLYSPGFEACCAARATLGPYSVVLRASLRLYLAAQVLGNLLLSLQAQLIYDTAAKLATLHHLIGHLVVAAILVRMSLIVITAIFIRTSLLSSSCK